MLRHLKAKNIFNSILFIWIVFIPFKDAVYQAFTGFIVLFFFIYLIKNNDFSYFKELLLKYKDLLIIVFIIVLSMTISNLLNDTSQTKAWITEANYLYRYVLIFFILIYFYTKNFYTKKLFTSFIVISITIQGIDGIYQGFQGYDLFINRTGDFISGIRGSVFHRNTYGMLMGIGVIISFILLEKKTIFSKNNILFSILFSLFLITVLFSYSRAVWVSLCVVLGVFIVLNIKKLRITHIVTFIILLVLLGWFFYNIEPLQHRLQLLLEGNSSHRYDIWLHTINLIQQKFIFGWGLDSWKLIGYPEHAAAHNSILEVLLYLGFFGFLGYSLLFSLIIKEIYQSKSIILFLLAIYFFIDSIFDQSITFGKVFLSTLLIFIFYIFVNRVDYKEGKKE